MSLWLDSRPLHGRRQGREIAPREVDVHARWKPERRRDEDRAIDQKCSTWGRREEGVEE